VTQTPRQHPSPNHGPRRDGLLPELVVLHYTAMDSTDAALARLCDPAAEVSAHYLITGQGDIIQMVPEKARAWHAGAGQWHGCDDINSRSIGIELDNRGDHPFSEPQMTTLARLLGGIMARWSLQPSAVIGHSDMAPGRKADPGPRFDWARLVRLELAGPSGSGSHRTADWATFRSLAQAAGYTATVDDNTLLATVRLRHRPWAQGALSPKDLDVVTDIARPVFQMVQKAPPEA